MGVLVRFISLILVVVALVLLGADLIASLEKGGQVGVRSIEQVWRLWAGGGLASFKSWLGHALPAPIRDWIVGALSLPAWAPTGVAGVVLAFLFGRRAPGAG